ncbi:hypothetical protein EDB85DRAFT_1859946, partial [Lactarius pseudohatsudake]
LSKKWTAQVYAFFKPTPLIEYVDGHKAYVFKCSMRRCRNTTSKFIRHYLYTADASSTSNLRRHAKICWGGEAIAAADLTNN